MSTYVQCPSLIAAVLMILTAVVFGILASFKFGRILLEKVIYFNEGKSKVITSSIVSTVPKSVLIRRI